MSLFYLLTDCTPTLSIDSPVHFNFLFSMLSNLPDCVTPQFLYHLNLPAIVVIAPLNTDTRGYPALLAHQQVCQLVNLLDGHAASQSLCFCVKTLIKNSHPWSGQWPDNLSTPSSFPLIGPHVFSVSFSASSACVCFKLIHFQQNWKTALIRNIINFFLRTRW